MRNWIIKLWVSVYHRLVGYSGYIIGCFILCVSALFATADFFDEEEMEEDRLSRSSQHSRNKSGKMVGATSVDQRRAKNQRVQQNLKKLEALIQNKRQMKETTLVFVVSKILNDDPNNAQALNALGAFYLSNNKPQLAKIIFTRTMKAHPKNSSLYNNMGVVALKQGEVKESISYFRDSLKYRYSNYSAAANLGTLYMDSYDDNSSLDYLELAYNRASSYLPKDHLDVIKIGNNYAMVLSWNGSFRKANSVFSKITDVRRLPPDVLLNYAILLGKDLNNQKLAFMLLSKVDLLDQSGRYTKQVRTLRSYIKQGIEKKSDKRGQ